MRGTEVTLAQMLTRREARAYEQKLLLEEYKSPLVSFTMNIPGPIKTNQLIRKAFDTGKNLLLNSLNQINAEILHSSEVHDVTGDELLLSVNKITPEILKDISIKIENASELGRLFDIDVITSEGVKLSRRNFRKCLLCDKQAQECARSRTHSVQDMQKAIDDILTRIFPVP